MKGNLSKIARLSTSKYCLLGGTLRRNYSPQDVTYSGNTTFTRLNIRVSSASIAYKKDAAMLKEHRYCDRIAACEVSEGEGGIGIRDATEGGRGRQGKTKETTCGGGDCMAACNPKPEEGEGRGSEQSNPCQICHLHSSNATACTRGKTHRIAA